MAEEIKKSYNPFKMWGSWVGGVLFPISLAMLSPEDPFSGIFFELIIIIFYLTYIILGFFIGWGIHSLIRKLRR